MTEIITIQEEFLLVLIGMIVGIYFKKFLQSFDFIFIFHQTINKIKEGIRKFIYIPIDFSNWIQDLNLRIDCEEERYGYKDEFYKS